MGKSIFDRMKLLYRRAKTTLLLMVLIIIIVIRGRNFNIGKIHDEAVRFIRDSAKEMRLHR